MKPSNDLKTALAACETLTAEARRLIGRGNEVSLEIVDNALGLEAAQAKLGVALADDNPDGIKRARLECSEARDIGEGLLSARQVVTNRLAELAKRIDGPLVALRAAFEDHRRVTLADLQTEYEKSLEALAAVARRIIAQADALGVNLPLANLTTLPGVTGAGSLALNWKEDGAAVKLNDQGSGPLALIRELERVPGIVENRRSIEGSGSRSRPEFDAVAHQKLFTVITREGINVDGKRFAQGDLFPADACSPDLLRMLYTAHRIGVRNVAA